MANPQLRGPELAKAIVKVACGWIGIEFNPGVHEQCAAFVRHVLGKVGLNPTPTKHPSDGWNTNPALANSFAGDDVGKLIKNESDLQPGDIVLYKNTYGEWRDGTITHVGIYVGGGMVVHRPTFSKPVQESNLPPSYLFREGRRLNECLPGAK